MTFTPQLDSVERLAAELRLAVQDAAVTACLNPNAEDLRRFRLIQEALNGEFIRARDAVVRCADEAMRVREISAARHFVEIAA